MNYILEQNWMDGWTLFLYFILKSVECFGIIGIDFDSGLFGWGEIERLRRVGETWSEPMAGLIRN